MKGDLAGKGTAVRERGAASGHRVRIVLPPGLRLAVKVSCFGDIEEAALAAALEKTEVDQRRRRRACGPGRLFFAQGRGLGGGGEATSRRYGQCPNPGQQCRRALAAAGGPYGMWRDAAVGGETWDAGVNLAGRSFGASRSSPA